MTKKDWSTEAISFIATIINRACTRDFIQSMTVTYIFKETFKRNFILIITG